MINRLIDMTVNIPNHNQIILTNANYTISEYAMVFLNGLGETQRQRFKKMLENGIHSGMSVAASYGLDYDDFINEVKKQLKIKN